MSSAVAAVDLGATSGRVMLGHVGHNELSLRPVARFPNEPVRTIDGLHWNILGLYRSVLSGLRSALRDEPDVVGIGIDSWAVDYALLRDGRMLGNPYHYRDDRTAAGVAAVHALVDPAELYTRNGLQFLTFNTLYQFAADQLAGSLDWADSFLLIPDLLGYWLTGRQIAERTNASTTGLLSVGSAGSAGTGRWDDELIRRLHLPRSLFPEIVDAGTNIGVLLPSVGGEIGAGSAMTLTAVGSHDTASAVVATPMLTGSPAYISCGTWGLVGVELEHAVLTEAGREANFTNEGGVDGRIRYLHNVMGLWLLNESVRTWEHDGHTIDLPHLLEQASAVEKPVTVFDANDPRFFTPGDMPARIREYCVEHELPAPASRPELVRSILESLAIAFTAGIHQAGRLSGRTIDTIHIVGGGSQNTLLCQLTADRSGLTVLAGPVEATAIGNVLVQARTQGLVVGDLETLRALVAKAFAPVAYEPQVTIAPVM